MSTVKTIKVELISENANNPRIFYNERALCDSIATSGIETPLVVRSFKGKKSVIILRGHRRFRAVGLLRKEQPTVFERLFIDGLPCVVMEDITDNEATEIMNDHGESKSLTNEAEIYQLIKGYYRIGLNENQTLSKVLTLLDEVKPLSGEARTDCESLKHMLETAKPAKREACLQAYTERVQKARRGIMQKYTQVYRNGSIVERCMFYVWTGLIPEGFEAEEMVKLTTGDVTKLHRLFVKAGKAAIETGVIVSANKPGKEWFEAFEAIKAEKSTGKKEGETRKSMARKDIIKPLEDGQIDSKSMSDVIRFHTGNKDVDAKVVLAADILLAVAETMRDHNPELWAQCTEAYKAYMQSVQG